LHGTVKRAFEMAQLERIFASFREGGPPTGSAYDPTDPDTYEYFVQAMIRDARDYEASVLAPKRDYATKLYYGLLPRLDGDATGWSDTYYVEDPNATYEQVLGSDADSANRSTYVSTDVRDAVMMMLPALVRCFAAQENPVYLVPRTPQDDPKALEGTKFVNYTFWNDNPGFLVLYGAFKDALTVKTGFVKWWTDDHRTIKRKTFTHISPMQIQMIVTEDQTARVYKQGQLNPLTGAYDQVVIQYEES